ncbi:MAG: CAP domain-containing protein [Phycisphaerae bacterium]
MRSRWSVLSLVSAVLGSLAGCPLTATSPIEVSPSLTSTPVASGSSASGAPASGSDSISQQFPECVSPRRAAEWRDTILTLVNRERGSRGLGKLTRNATLEAQAEAYACEMIHDDFFDHVNPVTGSTLRDRAQEFGYSFQVIGENLAAGQPTPEQAFTDWMNSAGHRSNILDSRFTELGIGIRTGGDYGVYWVQEFGEPR